MRLFYHTVDAGRPSAIIGVVNVALLPRLWGHRCYDAECVALCAKDVGDTPQCFGGVLMTLGGVHEYDGGVCGGGAIRLPVYVVDEVLCDGVIRRGVCGADVPVVLDVAVCAKCWRVCIREMRYDAARCA